MTILLDLARQIEADAEALGWDQPGRLFEVRGTYEDPYLVLTAVGHDLDLPDPFDLPSGALGVAFCAEAVRHMTYAEVKEAIPDLRDRADLFMSISGQPEALVERHWDEFTHRVSPLQMRPEARKETRYVAVVVGREMALLRRDRERGAMPEVRADGPLVTVAGAAYSELMGLASKPDA